VPGSPHITSFSLKESVTAMAFMCFKSADELGNLDLFVTTLAAGNAARR